MSCCDPGFSGPIDVVFTWVDGFDEEWRKSQDHWREKEGLSKGDTKRDPTPNLLKDELYFSLHQVLNFMPWVRNIFIFTQTPQRPKWLSDDPKYSKVKVVHHEDVFQPYAPLPSFNGLLNYSQIHHIPGLSEHFILFDDDFFVGKSLSRSFFFDSAGHPVYKLEFPFICWLTPQAEYSKIMINTDSLTRKMFGHFMFRINHFPVPLRKQDCLDVEQKLIRRGIFQKGNVPRFRNPNKTIEYPFLVANYAMSKRETRRTLPSLKTKYIGKRTHSKIKKLFRRHDIPHFFCVNQDFDQQMSNMFQKRFNF